MAWMIVSEDGVDGAELRADEGLMEAHRQYELSIRERVLAAGGLRSDDGREPQGSLLILDVETVEEARELFEADPATKAGLRTNIRMQYWNPAILNREEVG